MKGFFINTYGRYISGISNYRVGVYGIMTNGQEILLADGLFDMDLGIYNNTTQTTSLLFHWSDVYQKSFNLTMLSDVYLDYGGTVLY